MGCFLRVIVVLGRPERLERVHSALVILRIRHHLETLALLLHLLVAQEGLLLVKVVLRGLSGQLIELMRILEHLLIRKRFVGGVVRHKGRRHV